jgi:hypothetical protein
MSEYCKNCKELADQLAEAKADFQTMKKECATAQDESAEFKRQIAEGELVKISSFRMWQAQYSNYKLTNEFADELQQFAAEQARKDAQ